MKAIKGMPMFSPVRGNTFTKVMADVGGDYEKAKEILANDVATMKVQYGTGSPTTLKIDKIEYEGGSTSADKKPSLNVNRQIK